MSLIKRVNLIKKGSEKLAIPPKALIRIGKRSVEEVKGLINNGMIRLIKKRSEKGGLPPGTLVHIGEKKVEKVKITLIDYDYTHFEQRQLKKIEDAFPFKEKATVTWINIDGLHDVGIIGKLGKHFGLHPLIMEDILNTEQRPKIEDFGDYVFIVLKMLCRQKDSNGIVVEQISIILGKNFVLSFREKEEPIFDSVRERIKKSRGRLRKSGADYLTYILMDTIVDSYFLVLEDFGEEIEKIEDELVNSPLPKTLHTIHKIKRDIIYMRRSVWPLREVISALERIESRLIKKKTEIYLRDVYDHTVQIIDTIETYRDILSGMLDLYLSSISNRMNEVMKVLTIFSTIFIPLTFIVGLYGMNFKYMPELEWRMGYPVLWGIMIAVTVTMLFYFRKKKWL